MNRLTLAVTLTLLFFSSYILAAPVSYTILPSRTTVALSWQAFGGLSQAQIHGASGKVTLDRDNPKNSYVNVVIPVSSLTASNDLLTYQMKGPLFFDASRYREIAFNSDGVTDAGGGHLRVSGTLVVKGIRHPVTLDVDTGRAAFLPVTRAPLALHASTAISRSAFDMGGFTAFVDDRVQIDIAIAATP
ncbi:YceI family protein [Cronobacter dublinensis]|uniref:YceI family protein n=1 Tax=Cronobacter dublinensis TaxID=413497 RepID=UPI000CFE21E1|nr:YceI family protein [Cronobacter dublinensis]